MRLIPGTNLYWDEQGFLVAIVPVEQRDERVAFDERCARVLVGEHVEHADVHLHYRLRMVEDVLTSGGIPTGETKTTWAPKTKVRYERS